MAQHILSFQRFAVSKNGTPFSVEILPARCSLFVDLSRKDHVQRLFKAISGEEQPAAGQILFQHEPLAYVPKEKRPFVLIMKWNNRQENRSVLSYLIRNLSKDDGYFTRRRIAKTLLKGTSLENNGRKKLNECSENEWIELQYLLATVSRLDCILADSSIGKERLMHLVHLGKTVLVCAEQLDEDIAEQSDCFIFSDGELIQNGCFSSICEKPVNLQVATSVGGSDFIEGTVCALSDGRIAVDAQGMIFHVHSYHGFPLGSNVSVVLRKSGISLTKPAVAAQCFAACRKEGKCKLLNGFELHLPFQLPDKETFKLWITDQAIQVLPKE